MRDGHVRETYTLGLRKKVKDGNLPVIYQGQKKGV